MSKPGHHKGVALISVLFIMMVLFIIGAGFLVATISDMKEARNSEDAIVTLYLADAGIQYAEFLYKHNLAIYPWDPNNAAACGADFMDPATGDQYRGINLRRGQEFVVISNYSYGYNWLYSTQYAGTFKLTQQSITTNRLRVESVGYLKEVPSGVSIDIPSTYNPASANPIANWKVRAKRTAYGEIRIDNSSNTFSLTTWYERFR